MKECNVTFYGVKSKTLPTYIQGRRSGPPQPRMIYAPALHVRLVGITTMA